MVAPVITSLSPIYGQINAQTNVTIKGTDFVAGSLVKFGDQYATNVVVTPPDTITCKTPLYPTNAAVPVLIEGSGGNSLPNQVATFYFLNLLSSPSYLFSNPFFDPLANYTLFGQVNFIQKPTFGGVPVSEFDPAANYTITGNWSIEGDWEFVGQFTLTAATGNIAITATVGEILLEAFGVGTTSGFYGQHLQVIANENLDLTSTAFDVFMTSNVGDVIISAGDQVALNGTNSVELDAPLLTAPQLAAAVESDVVYYNSATKALSYGAAPAALAFTQEVASPVAVAPNAGYFASGAGAITFNLPAVCPEGSLIYIVGNSAFNWVLQAGAGQTIYIGNAASSVAGSATATSGSDGVTLVCTKANLDFRAVSCIGIINLV